jgi:hypothetical protein
MKSTTAVAEMPAAVGQSIEHIECKMDLTYNWGYEQTRKDLRDLYQKAQRAQWIPNDTLPWATDVDAERPLYPEEMFPLYGTDIWHRMTAKERRVAQCETTSWMLSQFLHGEQGALLATTQLVASVPSFDSKLYASTQVMDEARHVEVYDRYLNGKLGMSYPVTPDLKRLLDLILKDSRWDMKVLGMQIIVEGLALAAFNMLRELTQEPLLKRLLHYVMLDEARHVAFGVLSLRHHYDHATEAERAEREDFLYEASVLMRDRFMFQQVWEKMGLPVQDCVDATMNSEAQRMYRQMLFSKIVPAIKKMGLLSDRQRRRFEDLGILQFETWADPFQALADSEQLPPP